MTTEELRTVVSAKISDFVSKMDAVQKKLDAVTKRSKQTSSEIDKALDVKSSSTEKAIDIIEQKLADVQKASERARRELEKTGDVQALDRLNAKYREQITAIELQKQRVEDLTSKQEAAYAKQTDALSQLNAKQEAQTAQLEAQRVKVEQMQAAYNALLSGEKEPASIKAMQRELDALGKSLVQAEKDAEPLMQKLSGLEEMRGMAAKMGNTDTYDEQIKQVTEQLNQMGLASAEASDRYAVLLAKIEALKANPAQTEEAAKLAEQVSVAAARYEQMAAAVDSTAQKVQMLSGADPGATIGAQAEAARAKLESMETAAEATRGKIEQMGKTSKGLDAVNEKLAKIEKTSQKTSNALAKLGRRFKMLLIGKLLRGVLRSIGESMQSAAQQSGQFQQSMSLISSAGKNISSALVAAFSPLINILAPVFDWIGKKAVWLFNTVSMALGALFGQSSVLQAVPVYEEYGKAAESAGASAAKGAKEAKRALAGFDQITKLEFNKDQGGAGGGAGGKSSTPHFEEKSTAGMESVKAALAGLLSAAQPTIDALKRLWDNLEPLKNFVVTGIVDFWERFLKPLGEWTLGTGLPRFIDGVTNLVTGINWDRVNGSLKEFWDALSKFSVKMGEGLLWVWEKVLVPLGKWTMNKIVPRFIDILTVALENVNKVIDAARPGFDWLWENLLMPIADWTGGVITSVLDGIIEGLRSIGDWISENQPTIENIAIIIASFATAWGLVTAAIGIWNVIGVIATGVTSAFATAVAFLTSPIGLIILAIGAVIAIGVLLYKNWDEIKAWLAETWDKIAKVATETWNSIKKFLSDTLESISSKVKEMWNDIKQFFADLWNGIKTTAQNTWNGIKQFFVDLWKSIQETAVNIWSGMQTAFANTLNGIKKVFDFFGIDIGGIWENIKGMFSGIIDFIAGVFSGDWSRAWNGVVQIFTNIFDGMWAIVKWPLNAIIKGINWFIRGINSISFDLPSWLGGGHVGFDIGEIPLLAQGAVVEANSPMHAIIGDNPTQREIVAPENTLKSMMKKAIVEMGGAGGMGDLTLINRFEVDGEIIEEQVTKHQLRNARLANSWG